MTREQRLRELVARMNGAACHPDSVLCDFADELEDILNKESEAWLPIESALKTTKHVLLHGEGAGIVDCSYVGSWDETDNKWRLLGGFNSWLEPTHWQPLPAAPTRPADGSEKS